MARESGIDAARISSVVRQGGIYHEILEEASAIKAENSLAAVQLHHAGMRSPEGLIGSKPVAPSDDAETGARALSTAEVEQLIEDFIAAAERSQKAGFDGVEIHGAHGYILCQFLSAETNRRDDRYGGSLENRARVIREIIAGIRARCRPGFNLGLRLSPERFGIQIAEARDLAEALMLGGELDYLDMSLWDAFKEPADEAFKGRSLMSWFTDLQRGGTRLGVAGKVMTPQQAVACLDTGVDFVLLGRAAILHHDYPDLLKADPGFEPISIPVTREHLRREGLGAAFIDYMNTWKGFVSAEPEVAEPA